MDFNEVNAVISQILIMASTLLILKCIQCTDFNGGIRCSLIEASMGNPYSMTYSDFCNLLQEELSRLTKSQVLRVSFLELGSEYINRTLTVRNFH